MLKSKFLDIVKTFSPVEFKDFRYFVRSPFHNTNKNVMKITEILTKHLPDLNTDKLSKETIFAKIYPGKKYNDTVMRILFSDLLKLAEEYLAYLNFTGNPVNEKKCLLNELETRELNSLFRHHLKIAFDDLNKEGLIDVFYFFELYELQSIKIDNLISRGLQPESANDVLKQGEFLITSFLINILNIAHELESHKEVLNVTFDFNIVENFMNEFNINNFINKTGKNNYEHQPVLLIYYYMYLSYVSPESSDNFFKLKKLVLENFHLFTREEKFNLFIILESICTTLIASGKSNFYEHSFEIYELMLSENIYTHTNSEYFQINLFRNIFYTSLVLKKVEWTDNFVKSYLDKVIPKYKEDIGHLAFALIHFEKKDFEKALEEISKVNFNFFVFKFDVRVITLKIYYEINSIEPALSLIDTFTHFLKNNKSATRNSKEGFFNFLKFLKQLIRNKSGVNKINKEVLKEEINKTVKLINKSWLLEKAGEL